MADRRINIILTAVDKTKKGFSSATNSMKAFARSFGVVAKQLGAVFGIGAGAAVVGVKQLTDELDRMGKTATKLGATTEELDRLRFAAKQTGVDARTLDLALQRMVRAIGDAQLRGGEAAKAFEQLNLNVSELAQLSVEEQFQAIADAISGLGTESEQLSATVKIFQSEAAGIKNTLTSGVGSIKAYGDELAGLRDLISGEMVQAAADFNDSLSRMEEQMKGIKIAVGNEILPLMSFWASLMEGASFEGALAGMHERLTIMPKQLQDVTSEIVSLEAKIARLSGSRAVEFDLFGSRETLARRQAELAALEEKRTKLQERFAKGRQAKQEAAASAELSIADRLNDGLEASLAKRNNTYEVHLKQLEDVVSQEEEMLKRIEGAGRSVKEGIEAVQIGDELDAGDLFARVHEAIASLASGDTEAAKSTIENIAEAMDALNERGQITILAAANLRAKLSELVKGIAEAQSQDIIDSAKAQEEAKKVEDTLSKEIKPKATIEWEDGALDDLKRSAQASLEGFSVQVAIVPVVEGELLAGGGGGSPGTGGGALGDHASAEGHRNQ